MASSAMIDASGRFLEVATRRAAEHGVIKNGGGFFYESEEIEFAAYKITHAKLRIKGNSRNVTTFSVQMLMILNMTDLDKIN